MRGKRLIAPLMALLLITAGIGGIGVPDRVDPAQTGEAVAPVVVVGGVAVAGAAGVGTAALYEHGVLGGSSDKASHSTEEVPATNETVDQITQVDAQEEHEELEDQARYTQQLYNSTNTTTENRLTFSKTVAIGDAKAAMLREYRNNSSESEAVAAGEAELTDYYRTLAVNYYRGLARMGVGGVQQNRAYCAHPDFQDGDGCNSSSETGLQFNSVDSGGLQPDTTYNATVEIWGQNKTFTVPGNHSSGTAFMPWPDATSAWVTGEMIDHSRCGAGCSSMEYYYDWQYRSSYDGDSFDHPIVQTIGDFPEVPHGMTRKINSTYTEAYDNVDAIGANLYSRSPDVSDIDKAGFVGPSTIARRSLDDAETPHARMALTAAGINSTAYQTDGSGNVSSSIDVLLDESNREIEDAAIYTDAAITFEKGNLYDPDNYEDPIYLDPMNGSDVMILDQKFEIQEIIDENGDEVASVDTGQPTEAKEIRQGSLNASEFAGQMNDLSDRIEEIRQMQSNTGGGGGIGFGTGLGTPGLLGGGVALGVIVLLIARPWGA